MLLSLLDTEAERTARVGAQALTFEPMSEANAGADQEGSTNDLVVGADACKWDIRATLSDGTVNTLVSGRMSVIEDQSRPSE